MSLVEFVSLIKHVLKDLEASQNWLKTKGTAYKVVLQSSSPQWFIKGVYTFRFLQIEILHLNDLNSICSLMFGGKLWTFGDNAAQAQCLQYFFARCLFTIACTGNDGKSLWLRDELSLEMGQSLNSDLALFLDFLGACNNRIWRDEPVFSLRMLY